MRRQVAIAIPLALSLGCSGSAGSGSEPAGGESALGYWEDVKPVLDAKCIGCHVEGGIAPFPLVGFEDASAHAAAIQKAVVDRIMPPWLAGEGCSDYLADRSLSQDQIATLSDWVDLGAPEGRREHEGPPLAVETATLSRVDLRIEMPEPYTPQVSPDDYRCFLIDWPADATTFVTGFRAVAGQPSVVHHVIAFLVGPDQAAEYEALDAAEGGPGYTCFGGPGGDVESQLRAGPNGGSGSLWLGAWAPGSAGSDYPAGTGLRVEPGSKVALQVHYNTLTSPPVADQSAVEVSIEDAVDREARILPWADPGWILNDAMVIPAGEADQVHSFAFDPTPFMTDGGPFVVHAAALHMHVLGTRGTLEIGRADGSSECMLDVPRWDFHWQGSYGLREPKLFEPGDALSIECHWDNSAANQPLVEGEPQEPRDVNWGEGTTDEMCLGIFYVSAL